MSLWVSNRIDDIDVQVDKVRHLIERAASFGDPDLALGESMAVNMPAVQRSIDQASAAVEALDGHVKDTMRVAL